MTTTVPASIFRRYDIRGVVGDTLTPEIAQAVGRAYGSEAADAGIPRIVVGRDGRLSSAELAAALIGGLTATGRDVIDMYGRTRAAGRTSRRLPPTHHTPARARDQLR